MTSFFNAAQYAQGKSSSVDEIIQSTTRIADAFDLYNQKKFSNTALPLSSRE